MSEMLLAAYQEMMEEDPRRWEAIRWINSSPSPADETFAEYLTKWGHAVPPRHRDFVGQIGNLYDVAIFEDGEESR